MSFSLDGKRFMALSGQRRKVWEIATGRELHAFSQGDILSPDLRRAVKGFSKDVTVEDLAGIRLTLKQSLTSLAFSSDGGKLIGWHEGRFTVLDATTGQIICGFDAQMDWNIEEVVLSTDGKRVAARGRNLVGVWDAAGHELLKVSPRHGRVDAWAVSPNIDRVAIADHFLYYDRFNESGYSVAVWDVASMDFVLTDRATPGDDAFLRRNPLLQFRADGGRLFASSAVWRQARPGMNWYEVVRAGWSVYDARPRVSVSEKEMNKHLFRDTSADPPYPDDRAVRA